MKDTSRTGRGGDRGGRRPLSPAATLRKAEALAASLAERPGQLESWTEAELAAVVQVLAQLPAAFDAELARRFDAADDAEDAAEGRRILGALKAAR